MSQYDSIIRHLIDKTNKATWSDRLSGNIKQHLEYAAHYLKTDVQVLEKTMATKERNHQQVAFGVAFEDFLSRMYDQKNLVDVYLVHSGWKESNRDKRYVTALSKSQPSLFVVAEVIPGKQLTLIDQFSALTYLVVDKVASKSLPVGTFVYARVLEMKDHFIFSGVMLPFDTKAAKIIFDIVNAKETPEAVFNIATEAASLPPLRLSLLAMTFWLANILGVAYQSVTEARAVEVAAKAEKIDKAGKASTAQVHRKMIRSRLPELGDKTPRMAMRTKAGKQQVIDWLLQLEQTKASDDFAWIWQELGLERPA